MAEREHIHFVTGRLAEASLREVVQKVAADEQFDWSIDVLPITVAALMTPAWIASRLAPPPETTQILLPGYCSGELRPIEVAVQVPVERGPKDLRELPSFFGSCQRPHDYGAYDVEIIAEINHCPRLSLAELLRAAAELASGGADVIDVGCDPGTNWPGVGEAVRALAAEGYRVSIDSLNSREIEAAATAGAELVLSVNSSNVRHAPDWGVEVVAIPDDPRTLLGFDRTVEYLQVHNVPFRLDPVLEPIGFGFAASLWRYFQTRRKYPNVPMMMGMGNLTELTDADSAGINVLLLAICEELEVRSVLTTQVINWARTSVPECDLARRLVYHSITRRELPKHVEPRLVMLRDGGVANPTSAELDELSASLRDGNYRVYVADGEVHLVRSGLHLHASDPFLLMDALLSSGEDGGRPKNLDASHAFYLGYECCKAVTALTLSKQYRQDEALDWGYLTRPERHHRLASKARQPTRDADGERKGDG